ncbi:glycerate kinase [Flavobacteriaceae bacterium MAR_2009_75]|nr:glycerate kinase [Flavobacteriaceae bacterium MAR_2009_75]
MKFVVAPDKFKDSLTGFEFCDAVANGIHSVLDTAEIIKMPLADGGDGTMEVVRHYIKGEIITLTAQDPLFRPLKTSYLFSEQNKAAYIEMAEISGLKLLSSGERDCMHTTTFGTGQLIADALDKGAREIILGIGGSATNDGGLGMATALGYRFLDTHGQELSPVGSNLIKVKSINSSQMNPLIAKASIKIACDVTNVFYGDDGAAKVYGAQKGASPEDIVHLDKGLQNFSKLIKEIYKTDLQTIKGAGAAGGIGGGAMVFLNAELESGIELVKKLANFDQVIEGADWIITGEGQLDGQTLSGKTIDGVVSSAAKHGIPVAAFCGSVAITQAQQNELGIVYTASIIKGISTLEQAMKKSFANLEFASYNFAQLIQHTL